VRTEFLLDPDVVFLNHGSFGACPRPVFERYQQWQRELERQPVEFLARRLPDLLAEARRALAEYVGASADDLFFVPNATSGVNVAARTLSLRPGDEVLGTTLEYGACDLLWEHYCAKAGAMYVRAEVELPVQRADEVVDALFARVSERTCAVFVSHLTSETALVLPVDEIVARARDLGLTTIVDGAHAPAHVPVDLASLDADFYAGTCHKWMCAPKGAGFLHVRPELQDGVDGLIVSWGYAGDATFLTRSELQGTRDPSSYLTVPAAIEWLAANDWPGVQARCRELARAARTRLSGLGVGIEPVADETLVAQMVSLRMPVDDPDALKQRLYDEHRIEVPVFARKTEPLLRYSVAAYTEERELDVLEEALAELL
jgi:isopenicillin-N epimerase